MRFRTITYVLLFGILLAGCDSAEDSPPELQGRYDGTFTYTAPPGPFSGGGEVSESWVLMLEEKGGGDISGAGNLGDGMPVTVSGTHDHPDVTLEFTDGQNAFAGRFTGSLSDDERVLEGVYNFNLFLCQPPPHADPGVGHAIPPIKNADRAGVQAGSAFGQKRPDRVGLQTWKTTSKGAVRVKRKTGQVFVKRWFFSQRLVLCQA